MFSLSSSFRALQRGLGVVAIAATVACAVSADVPAVLDSGDVVAVTDLKTGRLVITDTDFGGQSHAALTAADGVLQVVGEIIPSRGQPGFVSMVMLLEATGQPQDLSAYEGIRLRIRITEGSLSVLAASAEIKNYDFHAQVLKRTGEDFAEIRVPFKDLKRVWSAQTKLNLETITSINLVASGMQKGAFRYEVDEVGFY